MNYLVIAVEWFIVGCIVSLPVSAVFIALYGDTELNKQIGRLRKNRLKLEKIKYEVAVQKFVIWTFKRGYQINIDVGEKKT